MGAVVLTIAAVVSAVVPGRAATAAAAADASGFQLIVVDDTADAVDVQPGDGECRTAAGTCSLRAAVQEANATPGLAVVRVPAGNHELTIAGQGEDGAATGDLDVTGKIVLTGLGRGTAVTGGDDRVLHVLAGARADLVRLVVRGGSVDGNGGGILHDGERLSLTEVLVAGNHAVGDGGGVFSGPGLLDLERTTVARNVAGNSGGGLAVGGPADVRQATISGNRVVGGAGGGVRLFPAAQAAFGFSTIVGNAAGHGASSLSAVDDAVAALGASIVAGAGPAPECDRRIGSGGGNLVGDGSCELDGPRDRVVADPRLGPLAFSGGPTPVHVPMVDSPAVDAIRPGFPPCPDRDQRGVERPRDGDGDGVVGCDRGSVER